MAGEVQRTTTELNRLEPGDLNQMFRVGRDLAAHLADAPAEPMRKHVREFQPLQDQLLVRRVKQDETDESGLIFLPESGKEKPIEAVVIACGPGRFDLFGRFVPVEVHPGERVILRKYAGTEIVLRGETCLLVSQDQTLGVIR